MGFDLTDYDGVIDYMLASTSQSDWNDRCRAVAEANGGLDAPEKERRWYEDLLARSRLYRDAARNWEKAA